MLKRLPVLTAATAALTVALAAQALAAPTISYHSGVGSAGPNSQGQATADCNAGEKALGGGIISSGGHGSSFVNGTNLNGNDGWFGDVDGISAVTLEANVACVGGGVASKLKFRERQANVGPASRKMKQVNCPKDYKVTGGGVSSSALYFKTEVKVTRPVDGGTAWEGEIRNFSSEPATMSIGAVCARGGFAKKLDYRAKDSTAPPGQQKSRNTPCRNGGLAIGGGTKVRKAASNLNSTGILGNGTVALSYVDAFTEPVKFTNYAVCYG